MAQPYVGEIRALGFNFAPSGWHLCDGSLLSISQNDTLFNLIGTTYGGDGQNTFGLPDLRGRAPVHAGTGFTIGQNGGAENVTLTSSQVPAHSHSINADSSGGGANSPANGYFATTTLDNYGSPASAASGNVLTSNNGSTQPHANIQPYLTINYSISLFGVYPTQN